MNISGAAIQSFPLSITIGNDARMCDWLLPHWGWAVSHVKELSSPQAVETFLSRTYVDSDENPEVFLLTWTDWQVLIWRNEGFGSLREIIAEVKYDIVEVVFYDDTSRNYDIDVIAKVGGTKSGFGWVYVRNETVALQKLQQELDYGGLRNHHNVITEADQEGAKIVWTLQNKINPESPQRTLTFTRSLSHNLVGLGIPLDFWELSGSNIQVQELRLKNDWE